MNRRLRHWYRRWRLFVSLFLSRGSGGRFDVPTSWEVSKALWPGGKP